ncbi:hypothetical protein ACEUZ9_003862 [Paracoccus litorisediminis]|jgi:hypothetical protein|nr:hypothetical protein [Paracoccus litorisediminis]
MTLRADMTAEMKTGPAFGQHLNRAETAGACSGKATLRHRDG